MKRTALFFLAIGLTFSSSPSDGSEYSWDDAEVLALETSEELLPPLEIVEQVNADLAAIRTYDPYFETIHVLPTWVPGKLMVKLAAWAIQAYRLEMFRGLDELNEQYGPVEIWELFDDRDFNWLVL